MQPTNQEDEVINSVVKHNKDEETIVPNGYRELSIGEPELETDLSAFPFNVGEPDHWTQIGPNVSKKGYIAEFITIRKVTE